jgi:hypothetical protein
VRRQHPVDFRVEELDGGVEVTTVVGIYERVRLLDVLVRNTRSPRRLRHGFQRNALSQTLELLN